MDVYRESGYRLKSARMHRGISQGKLADIAGVSRPTIYRIEQSGIGGCCVNTAKTIADALGVTLGYLMGEPFYGGFAEKESNVTN